MEVTNASRLFSRQIALVEKNDFVTGARFFDDDPHLLLLLDARGVDRQSVGQLRLLTDRLFFFEVIENARLDSAVAARAPLLEQFLLGADPFRGPSFGYLQGLGVVALDVVAVDELLRHRDWAARLAAANKANRQHQACAAVRSHRLPHAIDAIAPRPAAKGSRIVQGSDWPLCCRAAWSLQSRPEPKSLGSPTRSRFRKWSGNDC